MKTKIILLIFTILISINVVSGIELYNESSSFSGGGQTTYTTTAGGASCCIGGSFIGDFNKLFVDFTTYKEWGEFTFTNGYKAGATFITLTTAMNGINQNYTTFTSTVDGVYYGDGNIGWERTTGNNFNYKIIFDSINAPHALTLTGLKQVILTFDHNVYGSGNFAGTTSGGAGYPISTYTHAYNEIIFYDTTNTRLSGSPSVGAGQIAKYTFTDNIKVTFNNYSSTFGYLNLNKYNFNFRAIITNITDYSFYDVTSTTNVNYTVPYSAGLKLYLHNIASGLWLNRTIYSIITPISYIVSGNITVDKTNYNFGETILYNYTLSNAPTGITDNRIKIFRYDENFNPISVYISTNVQNGIFNKSYYVSDDFLSWRYYISLESWNSSLGWVELDYKMFNITSITPSINFDYSYYESGRTMTIYFTSNESGYIKLINPNGVTKLNYSHTGAITESYSYYLNQDDLSGNWTVNLYSSSGVIYASDYAINNEAIIIVDTTPVITPAVTEPENFLDIGTQISEIMIGKMTNDEGIVTDVKIQQTGNKIFGLLLTLVFICFVAGTYYTLTNKRR